MVPLALCVLVASAATILAHPTPDGSGVKIVSVLHGKDTIKAFIDQHPSVPYQLLGDKDPAFPLSTFGQPGKLKVLAVIPGPEAIAKYVSQSNVPIRISEGTPGTGPALGGASNRPSMPAPPARSNPRSPEDQERINSGLAKLTPYDEESEKRKPPKQETRAEQMAAWNSGLRGTPPDAPYIPASAPSNARSPNSAQQQQQNDDQRRTPPKEETYQQQMDAWNNGYRSTPPDESLLYREGKKKITD